MFEQQKERRAAKQARRDLAVLAFLHYRPGSTGYDLIEHLCWNPARVYISVERLIAAGKVQAWFDDAEPPRRRYAAFEDAAL